MNSDTPLDYAFFQLSPRRSRCELFVSGDGKTQKLASGLLKPFVSHLKVVEEQVAHASQVIRLDVEWSKNATWFNKGTLERFVRFVSTPEVLELVNTFDAEMSQLEGARRIYSQGTGDQPLGALGEHETTIAAAADGTKKELLRAIDLRLAAVKQDLSMACGRASAAGFTLNNVSELIHFAECFGAHRLNEACTKFISLCQQRPELISHQNQPLLQPSLPQWKGFNDENIRTSSGSDMSIDEPEVESTVSAKPPTNDAGRPQHCNLSSSSSSSSQPRPLLIQRALSEPPPIVQQPMPVPHHSIENEVEKVNGGSATSALQSSSQSEPGEPNGEGMPRRLSLKDRIKFFESKQKEQAASANSIISGTGGSGITREVGGKAELRRLPSDSSVEKSVLKRWSGASDMSIDLGSSDNRKESGIAAGTPSSSSSSQAQAGCKSVEKEAGGLNDTGTSRSWVVSKDNQKTTTSLSSSHAEVRDFPVHEDQIEASALREHTTTSIRQPSPTLGERGDLWNQIGASLRREQQGGVSNQVASQAQSKAYVDRSGDAGSKDQVASRTKFKAGSQEHHGIKGQAAFQIPAKAASAIGEQTGQKSQKGSGSQPRTLPTGENNVGVSDQSTTTIQFRTIPSKTEDVNVKPKGQLVPEFQSKTLSDNFEGVTQRMELPASHSQWKTFPGKSDEVKKKEAAAPSIEAKEEKEHFEGHQGMKLHRQIPSPDHDRDSHGRKVDSVPRSGNSEPVLAGRKAKESRAMVGPPASSSTEQAEMMRPSKGNQQLNDELQMKADELEKLFAAHKLRIHGDQMAPLRKSKPAEPLMDNITKAVEKRTEKTFPDPAVERNDTGESLSNGVEFDVTSLLKMVDNQEYVHNMKQKLGSLSEDLRGKFYEKYMQKRDAKLREEWGSKRAQKEAKMKAMHDSLERSQAEMKAKFSASAGKQNLTAARRRVEKLRSFNAHTAKNKNQTVESQQEGEEDTQELSEQVHYSEDKSYSDAQYSDGSSRSSNSKKLLYSKTPSSANPRTSAVPVPRPSAKATNSGSVRRKTQSENPLAQSVPNFSDLRKENTKPLSGIGKVTTLVQSGNFSRSKSITEETNLSTEDKRRRPQSMRKSSVGPGELKDLSPLNSDGTNLAPLRFPKGQAEQAIFDKMQKNSESRTFLRKGNGIGSGSGTAIVKLEAFMSSKMWKNGEEPEGLVSQQENLHDMDKEDDHFGKTSSGGHLRTIGADSDTEKPRLNEESENSDELGSENGDILISPSQADDDLVADSLKLNTSMGNVQESPEDSPGYWNSHVHQSYSYAQEASDVDASVDSPSGSPASWNSHPLNQIMEADAARMRKKWGTAQIPVLASNASHQPRKDVTKGFKRLLKFGRKSRGPESLVPDGVSASTASEGDDDTEDGRDVMSRPSDDLKKSRMGYTHLSYDGINEEENFPEQVQSLCSSIPTPPANFKLRDDHLSGSSLKAPRSFFSLSSFRSKGSESKLR